MIDDELCRRMQGYIVYGDGTCSTQICAAKYANVHIYDREA